MRVISGAIILVALLATPALSQTYVGVKGGPLNISRDIDFDGGAMIGLLLGYDVPGNNFVVEGEFNTTVASAESESESYGDLDVTTLAFYGAYRSSGRFYLKGKVGMLLEYLSSSVTGITTIDVDGAGIALSLGIGGGVRLGEKLGAEIEYTSLEGDIGYASLGLNWMF